MTEEMRAAAAAAAWGGDEPVAVAGPDDVATDADAKETAANSDVPGELAAPEGGDRRRAGRGGGERPGVMRESEATAAARGCARPSSVYRLFIDDVRKPDPDPRAPRPPRSPPRLPLLRACD